MKVRRRQFLDEYVQAGESAVLVDEKVLVLSALATTILAVAGDGWTDLDAIAAAVERAHGAPPGADLLDATVAAVDSLVDQGLLDVTSETN